MWTKNCLLKNCFILNKFQITGPFPLLFERFTAMSPSASISKLESNSANAEKLLEAVKREVNITNTSYFYEILKVNLEELKF